MDFLHNLPFYGLAILCLDDATLAGVMPRVGRPIMTYGLAPAADVRAVNVRRNGLQTQFDVLRTGTAARGGGASLTVTLNLPGTHNVGNALAAIAVATELGIEDAAIARALTAFQGIDRRLQHIGEATLASGTVTIVDDYGHHPTEIAATLEALRHGYPGRRLVLVFQPHRYTRTRDLIDDFGRVLSQADVLLVTEVYSAGEAAITGADGRAICRAVRSRAQVEPVFVENVERLAECLRGMLRGGDVVVTMGAGNINAVSHGLPAQLSQAGS